MVGQEFGDNLARHLWFRISHKVADKLSAVVASSEVLTGAGEATSKMAHSHGSGQGGSPCLLAVAGGLSSSSRGPPNKAA